MPAQGIALVIGSGVESSNALKGQNRFLVKNLVSPFQGWADSHSDRIPRADPASGVSPAWALLFRPLRGGRKAQLQNFSGLGQQFLPACHLKDSVGQLLESLQIGNGINRSLDEGLRLSKSPASQSLQDSLRFLGASLGASLPEDFLVGH